MNKEQEQIVDEAMKAFIESCGNRGCCGSCSDGIRALLTVLVSHMHTHDIRRADDVLAAWGGSEQGRTMFRVFAASYTDPIPGGKIGERK
jgi:hypothetical protein